MAKKKAEGEAMAPAGSIRLRSPHGGPTQVGTAEAPRDVDADGIVVLDPAVDADLIALLTREHGFVVVTA